MTSKRLYFILLGGIVLLLAGLVGGAYGLNKVLITKGDSLTGLKATSLALAHEETGLHKAKKQIATYADLEKVTQTIVPEDKSQAEGVREIVNIAAGSHVTLTSITFPESTLGTSAVHAGATTPAPAAASPAPSASANSKANSLSQLQPVPNIPGVYLMPITIQNTGAPCSYSNLINFLKGLEQNRRTAVVSSINIQPDAKDATLLTFTITLNEYIKP